MVRPSCLAALLTILIHLSSATFSWEAKLYRTVDKSGNFMHLRGNSAHTCVNTLAYQLCDGNSCASLNHVADSVNTMNTCIRIYEQENCRGSPLMEIGPHTLCNVHWWICNIKGRMRSIGGCPSSNTNGVSDRGFYGNFGSPNYPLEYSPNTNTSWSITVAYGDKVKMIFDMFDTEGGHDFVEIQELVSRETIRKLSGPIYQFPFVVVSRSNQVLVNFKTDNSVQRKGFFLRHKSTQA